MRTKKSDRIKEIQGRIRENVVYLRELMEITQAEFARQIRKPQSTVSMIETGDRTLGLATVIEYADYFGVPLGLILDHDLRKEPEVLSHYDLKSRRLEYGP